MNGLDPLPIRREILKYDFDKFNGDLRASINVVLITFPQAMAYALIAGLPIDYGLYGATVATIAAALFSGTGFTNFGPTNSTSMLLLSSFATLSIPPSSIPIYLPILLLLTGIFLILSAFFNVANLVQYISKSVIFGYITSIVVLMISHQAHNLFGFSLEDKTSFLDVLVSTFDNLSASRIEAIILSIFTAIIYVFVRKKLRNLPYVAITIIAISVVSYIASTVFNIKLQFLESVNADNWAISWNGLNFEHISLMADTALTLSFLCLIDGTTISKSMSARMGKPPNVNQVVFSLGIANLLCGFFSGMPASGSLVRSAVSYRSGAKTAVSSIFCGIWCLLGIIFLGPLFKFIPKAGLSTIIVMLAISLLNIRAIKIIVNSTRSDATVFIITFVSGLLFPLNTAIFIGVFISIALFLRKAAIPEFHEFTFDDADIIAEIGDSSTNNEHPEISIVHIEGNLFFAASDVFREQIRMVCERNALQVIILKMRNAMHIDATCIMALEELVRYMQIKNRALILSEVSSNAIKTLKNSGLIKLIGVDNIFADNRNNPNLSTAKALKRAKNIIGQSTKTQIRIFTKEISEVSYRQRLKSSLKTLVAPIQKKFKRNIIKKQ